MSNRFADGAEAHRFFTAKSARLFVVD